MYQLLATHFEEWRLQARDLLSQEILPTEVSWSGGEQQHLFGDTIQPVPLTHTIAVPRDFVMLARKISYHRSIKRWDLLYQLLWRLLHGEKHLLRHQYRPADARTFHHGKIHPARRA